MVSPTPTPTPVSFRILGWKPGAAGQRETSGFATRFPAGHPFHLHFPLRSFPSSTPPSLLRISRRADLPRRYSPRRVSRHVHLYFLASSLVPEMCSTFDAKSVCTPQKNVAPCAPYPRGPGLHLRGFAFPGINSVHLFCKRISIEEQKVRRFFCLLRLGWEGWGPPPRGAPLSLNPRGLRLF